MTTNPATIARAQPWALLPHQPPAASAATGRVGHRLVEREE
jgi:hypothetical protein